MKIRIEFEIDVDELILVEAGDVEQAVDEVKECVNDVLRYGLPFKYKINKTDITKLANIFIDTHEYMIIE